jgi:hypothetical protein
MGLFLEIGPANAPSEQRCVQLLRGSACIFCMGLFVLGQSVDNFLFNFRMIWLWINLV